MDSIKLSLKFMSFLFFRKHKQLNDGRFSVLCDVMAVFIMIYIILFVLLGFQITTETY